MSSGKSICQVFLLSAVEEGEGSRGFGDNQARGGVGEGRDKGKNQNMP